MDTIAIVDTSICTDNLGDEIIMDAVNDVVLALFPESYVFRVPSHEALSNRTRKFISQAKFCFVGGTNLIQSDLRRDGLWRVAPKDANVFATTRTVLLGTGWKDYMTGPTPPTLHFLKTALSPDLLHAARDAYTRDYLGNAGIQVVAASCPTTWALSPAHCRTIPTRRAPSVIFTLTAWRQMPDQDRAWINVLKRHYEKLFFFPQMQDDYDYFRSFGLDGVKIVRPTIQGYNQLLENEDVDFVGTRLHGGIRALQKGRRALILGIDNRATEISRDTSLPVIQRHDVAGVENWIESQSETVINLPTDKIDQWRAQFSDGNVSALRPPRPPPPDMADLMFGAAKRVLKYAGR